MTNEKYNITADLLVAEVQFCAILTVLFLPSSNPTNVELSFCMYSDTRKPTPIFYHCFTLDTLKSSIYIQ